MPKTTALIKFENTLQAAEALIEMEKALDNPPKKSDQSKASGLRGGAAVLMVASFEAFLKNLIVEHLTELTVNPAPIPFNSLPEKMRISSIFNCLDSAIKGPLHKKTAKIDRIPDIKSACAKVAAEIIDPQALSSTRSNPSSETVKDLFGDLGVPDLFGTITPKFMRKWHKAESATFVPDKLNEIVQRRHRVAHTGAALDITRSQLNESLKFLRILSSLLDAQLRDHIDGLYHH